MFLLRSARTSFVLLASAGALTLAGCGIGNIANVSSNATLAHGVVNGGPNPISGATVRLYSTGNTGYGSAGTLLGTATTGANGGFTFSGATPCTSPNQAFITVNGGNTGAGTNSNYMLMAALGDCSTVNANTTIWINELSTVAAAFALNKFITVSGTTVQVGAPATASLATGSCTNTVGSGGTAISSCNTASLTHAFQNALNLVDSVSRTVSGAKVNPTGNAWAVTPTNTASEAPQALVNTLGDALVSCVNSTGGAAGDSNNCGALFTATTPAGGAAPTNTVQAMVNLAQNPSLGTAAIYGLVPSVGAAYQPTLTAAPTDFSLAIVYKGTVVSGTTTGFGYVRHLALDANDNVYAAVPNIPGSGVPTGSGVAAIASNGATLFSPTFGTTYFTPRSIAVDNLGYAWVTDNAASGAVLRYSGTDGTGSTAYAAATPTPYGVAIDNRNNVWFSTSATSGQSLYELKQNNSYTPVTFASPLTLGVPVYGIAVDNYQNVWGVSSTSTNTTPSAFEFPNTAGAFTTPAYANAALTAVLPSTVAFDNIAIDGSGAAYAPSYVAAPNLLKITPNTTISTPSSLTVSGPFTSGANKPEASQVAGNGIVWSVDYNITPSYLAGYNPTANTSIQLRPCRVATGTTVCGTNTGTNNAANPALYNARAVQIDSTGSVWIASSTADLVTQVIGVAYPTWPLLAYGQPGKAPGTVYTLPIPAAKSTPIE